MSKLIKKLTSFVFLFLLCIGLSSCSSSSSDKFTLRVGLDAGLAPFNWEETKASETNYIACGRFGEYVDGYDVDIAKFLCEDNNWNLEIYITDWNSLIPNLQSDLLDVAICGMGATEERRQSVDFSDGYYQSKLCLIARVNDSRFDYEGDYFDLNNLEKGIKFIQGAGSYQDYMAQDFADKYGITYLEATDLLDKVVLYVGNKTADCSIYEYPSAQCIVKNDPTLRIIDINDEQIDEKYLELTKTKIALRKGDPKNIEDKINTSLKKLDNDTRNEWMDKAVDRYLLLNSNSGKTLSVWQQIGQLLSDYGATFGYGVLITLILAIIGTVLGLLLGILLNQLNELKINPKENKVIKVLKHILKCISKIYCTIFRGTPMMVQAILLFSISSIWASLVTPGGIGAIFNGYVLCGAIVLILNFGAFMSETVKTGMNSVDKGQDEAALSLGVNGHKALWEIKLPQAIKNILPSIGNDFIVAIKDSSVLNVIGLTELYRSVSLATKTNYFTVAGYIIIAVIYLLLTIFFGIVFKLINNKLESPEKVNWFGIRRSSIDKVKNFFKNLNKKKEEEIEIEVPKVVGEEPLLDINEIKLRQREESNRDFD